MTYKITESYITVPWQEGVSNGPANLVSEAKLLAETGKPTIFAKLESNPNTWVILSINELDNKVYVERR